jgi:hypothetical protein
LASVSAPKQMPKRRQVFILAATDARTDAKMAASFYTSGNYARRQVEKRQVVARQVAVVPLFHEIS